MHYILCKTCMKHAPAQHWWKQHHTPSKGFQNYIGNTLGADAIQVNAVSATSVDDDFIDCGIDELTSGIMEELFDNVCV